MARINAEEGFSILKDSVAKSVKGLFPIVGKKHTLELKDLQIQDDLEIDDIKSQKEAKLRGRTWAVPVEAKIALKDSTTGEVIDEHTTRLLNLPKTTRRHSQIVDGQEYQIDNQWRLKPGVYARVKDNGELESAFNLSKGRGFSLAFNPKERKFNVKYGTSHIPLQPLLQEMGIPQAEIEKRWGKEIAQANIKDPGKALTKFFKASTRKKTTNVEEARKHMKETFDATQMMPEVNKLTLGKGHDKVTGEALLDASTKLLKVSQGEAEPDARDALMFKELHSTEDFFAERLQKGTRDIMRRVNNTLDKKTKVKDIVGPDVFNKPIRDMYRTSLANIPEQTNPLEMLSGQMKTTITGEGGIKSAHGITEDAKLIDPSHLGYLDPIHTPEGQTTGVSLRLPFGVKKDGHDVKIKMYNIKTGKLDDVDPKKAMESNVVLPDQVKWVEGKPVPVGKSVKMSVVGNDVKEGNIKDAHYVLPRAMQMFSIGSNLIPFLAADHPLRSTMAGRHMEQAISLKEREVPLVQSLSGNKTFEEVMGTYAGHASPTTGKVVKVTKEAIQVKDAKGKVHERQIYDHFPLNADKSFVHSTPTVKEGDKLKKGQSMADTNFTKDGKLALGTNLKVGYMPYKGYNFEDGVVLSETAAKKLASEHLYRKTLDVDKSHTLSKSKFQAYVPEAMTREQADKLDDDGVMQPGQKVMPGDTLIAALQEKTDQTEDRELAKIHKSLVRPYKDASVRWEGDQPGVVTEVVKRGKQTAVHVKTLEPMEIGDKLCFSPDTYILTTDGWKSVTDVTLNDVCYTINGDGIELHEPSAIHNYPVGGEMYELASQQVDLTVTSSHNLYVERRNSERFELLEARDAIGKRVRHRKDAVWKSTTPDTFRMPEIEFREYGKGAHRERAAAERFSEIPIKAWATFLGIYLANGSFHIYARKDKSSTDYATVIHSIEGRTHSVSGDQYAWICSVLDECGFSYTKQPDRIKVYSKQLTKYVSQFGHAGDKHIPKEVFSWGSDAAGWVLDGLLGCDGNKASSLSYCTTSKQLADDVQILALHRGWAANIKERANDQPNWAVRYDIRLVVHKCRPQVNHGHADRQSGQTERLYVSDIPVYGITVPNGTLYVRVNGKSVWTGNSGRHGNKGIVTKIIADDEMPKTKDGPLQLLLNPTGVPGRTNLGQVLETAAAKIAEKTGKPYVINNFQPNTDLHAQVKKELKVNGIEDKEEVFDPNGKKLGEVLVGPQYIVKLKHQVDKKMVARAGGPGYVYDRNMIPKGGGPHGAQSLGTLGLHSMLAHGAKANLREMQTYKSDASQGDEFWAALQAGEPLPAPRTTFAYGKFISYLKGLGVNVKKEGNNLTLVPFTDKQVEEMSNGAIKDGGKLVRAKDLKEEAGGLFDPTVTGGHEGKKWSHIKLPEAYPNPLFEKAIKSLVGLKSKDFNSVVNGVKSIDPATGKVSTDLDSGVTGGPAIAKLLNKIDVDKELETAKQQLSNPKLKGNRLDKANKKVKYLTALKKAGLKAEEAYMMKNIPVLPPSMRPISQFPNGDLNTDDLNNLYKGVALDAKKLKEASPLLPEEEKSEVRASVYDGLKALAGLGGHLNREFRGITDILGGKKPDPSNPSAKIGQPKSGFFQDKLVQRKQDLSMRSTIIPEPALGLDEVGLPRKAAMEIYKPFIIRELRGLTGATPLQAQQMVKDGGEVVNKALERVAENRPVLLKRDPALHKHNIQAFRPRITGGKAVKIHPLVTSGFNADFDGDTMAAFVPVSAEAVEEARQMYPSRNLFSPATGGLMYKPTLESQLGLYGITQVGEKTSKTFSTIKEVESAHRKGEITLNDQIKVGGINATTGRFMVAGALPASMRKSFLSSKTLLDGKGQKALLTQVAKDHRNDYGEVVNKLKDLGNKWSTETAFTIGLDDIAPEKAFREEILNKADLEIAASGKTGKERDVEAIKVYDKATTEMHKKINTLPEGNSALLLMNKSGIKPTMDTLRQIKMAPMLFANAKGETIPTPAKKSFSEGLDLADYWTSMSGARKGIIQKVQSVQEPGYISKQVMNSVMNNSILDNDCGTESGISLPVDEKDILDRYLAQDVTVGKQVLKKGTLITPAVRSSFRNNKIRKVPVRTPLRCQHGPGVCAKSMLPETVVTVFNGEILNVSLERLFDTVEEPVVREGEVEIRYPNGWDIMDGGNWVKLERVVRHPRESQKKLLEISTTHGRTHHVTEDHTSVVYRSKSCTCGSMRISFDNRSPYDKAYLRCRDCLRSWTVDKRTWEFAEEMEIRSDQILPGDRLLYDPFPQKTGVDPDLDPYWLGLYLAEGSTDRHSDNPRRVIIAQTDNRWRPAMLAACARVTKNKISCTDNTIALSDVQLVHSLLSVLGRLSLCDRKTLPAPWLGWSDAYVGNVVAGLIDGDGHVRERPNGTHEILLGSTSYTLLSQVQDWLAKHATRANLACRTQKPSGTVRSRRSFYHLTFSANERVLFLLRNAQKIVGISSCEGRYDLSSRYAVVLRTKDVSEKIHAELVYDVTTSSRRFTANGIVTHNCYGLDENGKEPEVGLNVGVIAGQALGERATQLSMKAFHSGGTASTKEELVDNFQRVKDLLQFPKTLPGSATLSTANGTVSRVQKDPAGGHNVYVKSGNDEVRHYIPQKRGAPIAAGKTLRTGARVKKGMAISRGPINPHEMLPLTGVEPVQSYLAGEIHKVYGPEGIRRRNTEVVVKGLTNLTRVDDPGDHKTFIRGDFVPASLVANINRQAKDKKPITHLPVLKGVNVLPLDMQEDWIARMNHQKIKSTVVDAALEGWTSQILGTHPIPPAVYGVGLGKAKQGEY